MEDGRSKIVIFDFSNSIGYSARDDDGGQLLTL
jgi:hypothetical protein